ncbi:MAG: LuxR family transcriptional regulator, partial [Rhizobiaceae bacterium]
REYKRGPFRILMHCYTSGARLAQRALDLDARFSVSGILSFKGATDVRDVMTKVPLERIILETDCPYLAPIPHRGRRNEPAYLVAVCKAFAEHRGLSFEEAARLTTANAIALFQRAA